MKSKRPKKPSVMPERDLKAIAVDAALALAALRDWNNISLSDIAAEAGVSLAVLSSYFDGREDILAAYGRRVDHDVLAAFAGPSGGRHRDDLFDLLMERFDRLNADRGAVVSILSGFCDDPKQMVISLPHLGRSMTWMLEACGIETTGWRGALRVAGLCGVYLYVLRIWHKDESPDMAKTMAALDTALGRCEQFSDTIGL